MRDWKGAHICNELESTSAARFAHASYNPCFNAEVAVSKLQTPEKQVFAQMLLISTKLLFTVKIQRQGTAVDFVKLGRCRPLPRSRRVLQSQVHI